MEEGLFLRSMVEACDSETVEQGWRAVTGFLKVRPTAVNSTKGPKYLRWFDVEVQ